MNINLIIKLLHIFLFATQLLTEYIFDRNVFNDN